MSRAFCRVWHECSVAYDLNELSHVMRMGRSVKVLLREMPRLYYSRITDAHLRVPVCL